MINIYILLSIVHWEIPTDAKELYLALYNAVNESCTVKLQFQCQSLNKATKHLN